ncbi:MAG: galactose mutarotase [Verrucomicrobia bacterium]|nr:MAG: galactose mutarotase [Verrucomicrobiota bacterium]TAE87864.1 MAG: galactose mutarotase [Verrucomicrobiota bacterium]TAF25607.1 MAG: galactose mutarotase [Verrucomicrobiota bacterium]TAF41326.1 MAG: galactose mutarotase [Verrucomicrobiota bacterium]
MPVIPPPPARIDKQIPSRGHANRLPCQHPTPRRKLRHRIMIHVESFGKLPDGREAQLFTLVNARGLRARISDFGATLVAMETPDRHGDLADITLGFDDAASYLDPANPYLGATAGRFANRIRDGKFSLDGKRHQLATNNQPGGIPCHLHGGEIGFNRVLWTSEVDEAANAVTFIHLSPDGDEAYPGTLLTRVTYTLTADDELKWEVSATTDAPTIVNIVHHSYWNLDGNPAATINDHLLSIEADHFLPTDAGLIPTGEICPVAGTPLDFTNPTRIGDRIDTDFAALQLAGGYDHAWVLRPGSGVRYAARLFHPASGRTLEVLTDQPAIQFYGGNFLGDGPPGKGGVHHSHRGGLCLETENFPDAPNQPGFPNCILRPGETYCHTLIHRFSAH